MQHFIIEGKVLKTRHSENKLKNFPLAKKRAKSRRRLANLCGQISSPEYSTSAHPEHPAPLLLFPG